MSEKALKETHTPQMVLRLVGGFQSSLPPHVTRFAGYGLGWFVHDYRGHLAVSHGGTLSGFRAQLMMVPEKNVGVFVVANLRPSVAAEAVSKTLLDRLLDLPALDWIAFYEQEVKKQDRTVAETRNKREAERNPNTKSSRESGAYSGSYEEPAYGRVEVTADGDKLVLCWGKFTFRLDHYHFDTFTAVPIQPAEEVFRFDRTALDAHFRMGRNGEVEGIQFLDQEFKRIRPMKK